MKKMICIILCMVLLFGIVSPATANESMLVESVSTVKVVKPIAYTHDFDGYSNVVGVLNSDGTKTAYLFSSAEQVEQIDSLTGLISSPEEQLQRMNAAQSRAISKPTIVDAPVYSNYPTMNYNASSTMFIGGSDEAYGYGRVYIKTDVSALDNTGIAYSDIISASLNFTERQEIEDENRAATIEAYLVKESWDETEITWNDRAEYYNGELIGCTNAGFNQSYEDITTHPCKIYI